MTPKALAAMMLCLPLSQLAQAKPVILDLDEAKVIITRPVDQWSSDSSKADESLEVVKTKKFNYIVDGQDDKPLFHGPLSMFQSRNSITDPSAKAVDSVVQQWGADYTSWTNKFTTIKKPFSIEPDQMEDFVQNEQRLYEFSVQRNGDPETAQSRTTGKKVLGGILTAGLTVLSMATFGLSAGFNVAENAGVVPSQGLHNGIGRFGTQYAPEPLPKLDFSAFKQVDIRPVVTTLGDRMGQLVIAYKVEKTPEVEKAALEKAVPYVFGLDSTVEEVQAAREADFTQRKAIWAQCVADKQCS